MNLFPDNRRDSRMPELDGIRGLAIILVLAKHYIADSVVPGTNRVGDWIHAAFMMGWTGVELFFVLSGFLIGGILMDSRGSKHYFPGFYLRRGCRILPLFFLNVCAFYVALDLLSVHYGSQHWFGELFTQGGTPPFWANLTLTQNFYFLATGKYNGDWLIVTWSLVVEEQFYLLLPLAFWFLRPSKLMVVLAVVICANPLLQLYLFIFDPRWYDVVGNVLSLRGDALWAGVVCAYVVRHEKCRAWLAQHGRDLGFIFALLLLGMVCVTPRYTKPMFQYDEILLYNLLFAAFYACLVLLAATRRQGIVAAVMRLGPLRKMGIISYGVFLLNQPVNGLLHGLILGKDRVYRLPSDCAMTVAALFVTLVLAWLSWRFFEKPIIAWGHSYCSGKYQNQPVVPVPETPLRPAG
jgi:peptidoglycan/LPS O-acetylase OafA/YrhL